MKNILILCDSFPPAFAPRVGYLCKYLPEFGWNPIIVTEYLPLNIFEKISNIQNIKYINFFWRKNGKFKKLKYLFIFISELFFNLKNIIFKRQVKNFIKNQDFSVILTTVSWRSFPALTAKQLGFKYKIPFIVDCRDIYEQFPNQEFTSKFFNLPSFLSKPLVFFILKKYKNQRNKILQKANAVITVSDWHTQKLSEYNKNTFLIFNGFDNETFFYKQVKCNKFKITYTGRIESQAVKDPSLLFESIAYLHEKGLINHESVRIQFYLLDQSSKNIIKKIAEKYKVMMYVDYFDGVSNDKVPDILNESSILLLLANLSIGEKTPKGIMGTKTFEYLAVEKPILLVRNDESCLEETINNSNTGIAASSIEEVNQFIMEKYSEWQNNGYTHQNTNKQYIEQFSRRYQAKQFVQIFESLI